MTLEEARNLYISAGGPDDHGPDEWQDIHREIEAVVAARSDRAAGRSKEFSDAMRALMPQVCAVRRLPPELAEAMALKSLTMKETADGKNMGVKIVVTVGGFDTTDDRGTITLPKLWENDGRHVAAMPLLLSEAIYAVLKEAEVFVKSVPPVIGVQA